MLEENQADSFLLLVSGRPWAVSLQRVQKLQPGLTSPVSHGPAILRFVLYLQRFPLTNKSQLVQLVQIKHKGAMMADWLIRVALGTDS